MKVTLIRCGPAANESEIKAFEFLKTRLQSVAGDGEWILLTNLTFSVNHQLQSDEIDIVVIGPPGVTVIEVKHWAYSWMESNIKTVEIEADKVTNKARKIGTTLRKIFSDLPVVDGIFFLTREANITKHFEDEKIRGVKYYTFKNWENAILLNNSVILSNADIRRLARVLEPQSVILIDGSIRRFASYINLELLTHPEERYHRIYKGIHSVRQDRVVLHLYDLSASDDKMVEKKARREFEVLRMLQQFLWAPRVLDSFQEAPAYPGEIFFFTIVDPAIPMLAERIWDESWNTNDRIDFARKTINALSQMHNAGDEDVQIIHRNITPQAILVKYDNTPILTDFQLTKIPSDVSVASTHIDQGHNNIITPPEVLDRGLAIADCRSDIYSLCASLAMLFDKREDYESERAISILRSGFSQLPEQRQSLDELSRSLSELLGESLPLPTLPPARYWTEDQVVRFRDHEYRIVTLLGSGGVGRTFKVVETTKTGEELGTYVAKVIHSGDIGKRVLRAYNLARSHLGRHGNLSAIYEVAKEWQENDFVALMTWIEGAPLSEFTGVLALLAEDLQEKDVESLCIRWLLSLCDALSTLHRSGLIHGDISPKNIIVSNGDVVLTDYDFVTKIGEPIESPGTLLYCSPSFQSKSGAHPSDDFYALAASFFHTVFEKEPFQYEDALVKERGINWDGIDRTKYPLLSLFMDKATNPDPTQRFLDGKAIFLSFSLKTIPKLQEEHLSLADDSKEERVEWLLSLLQSYPGARWGNKETRGLDTPFATKTYVETGLEEELANNILNRRIRLLILCGNAGDGKTALLQFLAAKLGFGEHKSDERILEHRLDDGLNIRMNLDGSAAWRDRSADNILDEFLEPFCQGSPTDDIAHLLAVNDGRLLEWIESVDLRANGKYTILTDELDTLLREGNNAQDSYIRFISLNERSLVGGITCDGSYIQTSFLEKLVDRLYGGENADKIWGVCSVCSARSHCEIFRALTIFGPDNIPFKAPAEVRKCSRKRLFEALQAIHLRGEVHITARELRAALIYILFGIYYCTDYHNAVEETFIPYWDRAFDSMALGRQGEVLRELIRFDPALEAHPQVDRHLLSQSTFESGKSAPSYGHPLDSARRRAYFEWTEEHLYEIAKDTNALGLTRGRHVGLFKSLALNDMLNNAEKLRAIRDKLCRGISRLADLPPKALDRQGVAPLRIIPRTPTETAFWVEKPLNSFRIEADLPNQTRAIDRLHRQAWLIYRHSDGHEDRLRLGAELFHLLLELSEGYQLGDISNDDIFAHLSIFVSRLAREDEKELLAWNPMQDETIFKISAHMRWNEDVLTQKLVLS